MKRWMILFFMICLWNSCAFAESVIDEKEVRIYNANQVMESWTEKLKANEYKITDEGSQYSIEEIYQSIGFAEALIAQSSDSAERKSQADLSAYPSYSWSQSETDEGTITTLQAAPSQGVTGTIYVCKAEYTENDYRVKMETYDEEGNLLHKQRLEMAAKDDEMVVMLLDYNTELDILSKFATWIQADDAQTVYLLVFGDQEEIRLNPRAWSNGHQTFETWDDTLLMPTAL